jgi:hypothetical protein
MEASIVLTTDPRFDVARLSAEFPVALLPVRMETRFGTQDGAPCLRVRVYPDEIAADGHEPELTADETTAGETYWARAWTDHAQEIEAWRALLVRYSSARAAWIVSQTTPTNLAARPNASPIFPVLPQKAGSWTRPVEARVLPDRWFVVCFRNGVPVRHAVGGAIADPLVLTVSPAIDPNDSSKVVDISGDGLFFDKTLLWTVDFAAAEAAGMGITVPLDASDLTAGFDRVLVYGVRTSLDPEEGGKRLRALLDAHHYNRGLAFVPQGTPTNNTSEAASGFPPKDPNGLLSFAVERGDALADDGSVGDAFARAFGVATDAVDHLAGAERREQQWAEAMNRAMWPLTWGYFLEQLLDPLLEHSTIERVRDFWVRWVRGRGPLPAFRVGSTPYGLLPVTSLTRWQARRDASPVTRFLPGLLRQLVPTWKSGVSAVPRVNRGDPDQAMIDILAEDASAREVWIRPLVGSDAADNLARFVDVPWNARMLRSAAAFQNLQPLFGPGTRIPRVLGAVFHSNHGRFRFPLVASVLSETAALDFNYLRWIRTATLENLRVQTLPAGVAKPTALLYRLARHGALLAYRKAGFDLLDRVGILAVGERREPELVAIVPNTETRQTVWQRLAAPVAGVTAVSLSDHLREAEPATTPEAETLRQHNAALETLEALPTAELDRLFTETLDCCAHRLDAWVTALATERLHQMREARPTGVHLGAFAWVENLRPVAAQAERDLGDGRRARVQRADGGFIHAPSMMQAATAAVLRNGYLSRSGSGQSRYAIDCSSARVQQARWLLSGMREGQSLRALLGYQFERGLHERGLERYIEPLRILYPLPERAEAASGPTQGLSPRDVVDGLVLREEADAGRIPFGTDPDLPANDPDLAGVKAELARLSETFDAVSDVLTADAVHHLVRGTTMGANASLDAQAQGVRPPDPEFVRTPRGGIPLTHRVALVLGGDPQPDPWTVPATPRALAEPHLDRWLAALIGDPTTVRCRVQFPDPTPVDPNHIATVPVSLDQLGLRPLDLLALASGEAARSEVAVLDATTPTALDSGSSLDRRVVLAATSGEPSAVRYEVSYATDPSSAETRSFPEILELLRAFHDVIGKARPLRAADLLPSEVDPAEAGVNELSAEADQRANAALTTLTQRRGNLESALVALPEPGPGDPEPSLSPLRAALTDALAYSIVEFPPLPLADAGAERRRLIEIARSTVNDLLRREATAAAATSATEKVRAVFGREFPFLPRFQPGSVSDLDAALAHGPSLGATDAIKTRWMQQLRRVRAPLNEWGRLEMVARCLGRALPPFALAQIPHASSARWVGLPFQPGDEPPARRTSLAVFGSNLPQAAEPWVGLWLDEWNESIPLTEENTAIGFHYDDPGAEAAQTVLLAVPPTNSATWDADTLEAVLMETFDWAQMRAVHTQVPASPGLPGVPDLAPLLPAIYLAANTDDDTVSTDFTGTRVQHAGVAAVME